MCCLKDEAGFSFVELMVVIAIAGVLSAIAVPNLLRSLPEKRLKAAARNLYADMQRARLLAVKKNKKIPVRFVGEEERQYYYFDENNDKKYSAGEFRIYLKEQGDIQYGCLGTKKRWDYEEINESGLPDKPYITFSQKGTCNPASIFLHNGHNSCYAVTTTNYGYVNTRTFNGKKWDKK